MKLTIQDIERILLTKFRTEPFHNLYLIAKKQPKTLKYGGTCSDKTISFLNELKELGVSAQLHSSFINNQEIHRLVSLEIDNKVYFADVGNGWPSIKLFPKDYEVKYSCYGISYKSKIKKDSIYVYQSRRGKERLSITIPFQSKSEQEIMIDIAKRFDGRIEYPFSKGLRFSQVVNDKFLFLRDDTLYFFCENKNISDISGIKPKNISKIIKKYFNFDITIILNNELLESMEWLKI